MKKRKQTPLIPPTTTQKRRPIAPELRELQKQRKQRPMVAELYHRAELQLRKRRRKCLSAAAGAVTDARRLRHELEVHQIELEMQNEELKESRNRMERLLEKFEDFYDFAPVGYFSITEPGVIVEVNLTGAALLGVERSRLIHQLLPNFIVPADRPAVLAFLQRVFAGAGKQVCEATILRKNGLPFWADIQGVSALSASDARKWCRVVISDMSVLKQAEEAQRRAEVLAASNLELKLEIARRQAVEASLKESDQHQSRLLAESRTMQEQLRHLSRQVLLAQEEERKRVSRELHDVIAQTLTGINLRLSTLQKRAGLDPRNFDRDIERTQKLVEDAVNIIHQFARELRPAVLDDLGLVPALHSFMKNLSRETGIHIHLTAFAGLEELDIPRRTILYRVAQEALTNVSRHANATRVDITIQKQAGRISMKINDNGKSFDVEKVLETKGKKRLGLLGMRERLEMVGGHFEIESIPGQGTTVTAEIPACKPAP
jgi:PAS domain S-box-containing protein